MGLIQRIKNIFKPRNSWAVDDDRWYSAIWPQETNSGAKVDESNALSIPAVWACIRIISEDIGSLPLHLYTRSGGGKERAVNNPLYMLLHDRPNPEMSAMSFRETIASHILGWGNCYAEKEMDTVGNVKALWPWPPNKVEVRRDSNTQEIYYLVQIDESGLKVRYSRDQVLHIPGLSCNGLVGYSPIGKMREAVGMAMALEEFGGRFFGAGTHPGVVVSHPGHLGPTAQDNLKKSLTEGYSGLGKSHRLLLLEEGMKIEAIGIPPEDAQFLETRRFQLAEIARIYKMPLHKLQDYEKGMAFASVEQFSLDYVVHTLRPWLVRFEQGYNWQLFSNDLQRRRYFWEHLVDGLLRGDLSSRYEAYTKGRNWGWLSADDIRELENMNPLPDGKGKIYLQPLNMAEAGAPPPAPPQPAPKEAPEAPPEEEGDLKAFWAEKVAENPIFTTFKPLFEVSIEQILSREANNLKRVIEKSNGDLSGLLQEFYGAEFRAFMIKKISPAIQAFIRTQDETLKSEIIENEAANYIQNHIALSKSILLDAQDREKTLEEFDQRSGPMAEQCMANILERIRSKDHADATARG